MTPSDNSFEVIRQTKKNQSISGFGKDVNLWYVKRSKANASSKVLSAVSMTSYSNDVRIALIVKSSSKTSQLNITLVGMWAPTNKTVISQKLPLYRNMYSTQVTYVRYKKIQRNHTYGYFHVVTEPGKEIQGICLKETKRPVGWKSFIRLVLQTQFALLFCSTLELVTMKTYGQLLALFFQAQVWRTNAFVQVPKTINSYTDLQTTEKPRSTTAVSYGGSAHVDTNQYGLSYVDTRFDSSPSTRSTSLSPFSNDMTSSQTNGITRYNGDMGNNRMVRRARHPYLRKDNFY